MAVAEEEDEEEEQAEEKDEEEKAEEEEEEGALKQHRHPPCQQPTAIDEAHSRAPRCQTPHPYDQRTPTPFAATPTLSPIQADH